MTTDYKAPKPIEGEQLQAYVQQFTNDKLRGFGHDQFIRLSKDMPAFKRAVSIDADRALVNLVIPAGSRVFLSRWVFDEYTDAPKMRADTAFVHSIFVFRRWPTERGYAFRAEQEVFTAQSLHSSMFRYRKGETIHPARWANRFRTEMDRNAFSMRPSVCAAGIHFFLNVRDALTY